MTKVLLTGCSVFDVRSGQVAEAGERIVAVGRDLDADEAVDCSGALLVPGFIDCHTHVCLAETAKDPFGLPRSAIGLSAVPVLATPPCPPNRRNHHVIPWSRVR